MKPQSREQVPGVCVHRSNRALLTHGPRPRKRPALTHSYAIYAAAVGALVLAGCTNPGEYSSRADRAVAALLDERRPDDLRPAEVIYPDEVEPEPDGASDAASGEVEPVSEPVLRILTLDEALTIAITTGREYINEQESLFLAVLSLTGTRQLYSPQLSALLSYTFTDSSEAASATGTAAAGSVSQIMPWGADLELALGSTFSEFDHDGEFDSLASISLSQPLLRGSGRRVSHEPLIQAERNVIYALRSFERFREAYAIDVARRYYDLVEQKQALANQQASLESLEFARRQAEAKYSLGEVREVEVLRARRAELNAQNDLLGQEEVLQLEVDRFRVFLGLGKDVRVDVVTSPPEFVPVLFEVESSIVVARANRLDRLTELDRIEDSERGLALVRDALRASLNLNVGYTQTGDPEPTFTGQSLNQEGWNAGLLLDLPVNQVRERNAYRAAEIGYGRTLRAFDQFDEDLVVGVRSRFRSLRRIELSLGIKREAIGDEERNLRQAQFLFDRDEAGNRDVVEAQEALVKAQDDLIREQVNYEIGRLQLLRDLGILFIDETGMWTQ